MEFIDLKSQYNHIKKRINRRISNVLERGTYIMGPEVYELEEKLADYVGVKHCISCANGTDALQLALMAMDIGPGDAVYTSAFTFFATGEAISIVGATPIFVDIDPVTYNMAPEALLSAVNDESLVEGLKPKAIIVVDLFGQPANYPELKKIASENSLLLIEDAAQGFGGAIEEDVSCSFGDIATTSFFPAKPLGCYGDGGALFTDNSTYAALLDSLRVHGKGTDKYDNVRIGLNSRLDTIQAAILLEKLAIFDWEVEKRNELAAQYTSRLEGVIDTPVVLNNYRSSWAQYTLLASSADARTKLQTSLKAKGIPTAIYYPTPLHRQTAFELRSRHSSVAASELSASRVLSVPMHPYMDKKTVDWIASSIEESISEK